MNTQALSSSGAAALLLFLVGPSALAATGWSERPSWAGDETASSAPSQNRRSANRGVLRDVSPYSPGSHNIAVDLGQVFLMGDVTAKFSDSLGAQIHYTYGVSEIFGFDASLGYSEHANGAYSMASALAGVRVNLAWYDKIVPYVVFGLGFYRPSIQVAATTANQPTSVAPFLFGMHIGPGVDLELTQNLFFGTALTFHNAFGGSRIPTTPTSFVDVGGTFMSFLLHVGVTF